MRCLCGLLGLQPDTMGNLASVDSCVSVVSASLRYPPEVDDLYDDRHDEPGFLSVCSCVV